MAVSDYISRTNVAEGKAPLTVKDILTSMIMAHEIQGCMALENSFNRVSLLLFNSSKLFHANFFYRDFFFFLIKK